ncbi:lipopolysaccharide kinase InaA family protein [Geomonas oryzae]|uniref:lipopolysaccharide kinase InaA family protein n=1 Tax=Geomonas oryzae TaxID=2364273 RepID=UPI00100BE003|nr:lipopolysaccharide kinase InaA family protein [Geomonas oryzae]
MTADPAATRIVNPDSYLQFVVAGRRVVARAWAADAVREALTAPTLHDWAAARTERDVMHGRGACYGVTLPGAEPVPVVVRRNRHGGLLRYLTGERFLPPTRAPLELANAVRLAEAGVPTPEVIAYALYPAAFPFVRCDVMTRRLPAGGDLPERWQASDAAEREALLQAVALLLRRLEGCGAWHPDLNMKNIYVTLAPVPTAYLLDVDRVLFPPEAEVARRNYERLARSARKWRDRWGLQIDEEALARLASLAMEKN